MPAGLHADSRLIDHPSVVRCEGDYHRSYPKRGAAPFADDRTDLRLRRQAKPSGLNKAEEHNRCPFHAIHGNYEREGDSYGRRMKGRAAAECLDMEPEYETFGSVWFGEEDAELLERLLLFYPRKPPRRILDATINGGRFWRKSTRTRSVIGLDIDPQHRPKVCGDNMAMPFKSEAFDVVVYDPPHIPNQGKDRSKDFNIRIRTRPTIIERERLQFLTHVPCLYVGGLASTEG